MSYNLNADGDFSSDDYKSDPTSSIDSKKRRFQQLDDGETQNKKQKRVLAEDITNEDLSFPSSPTISSPISSLESCSISNNNFIFSGGFFKIIKQVIYFKEKMLTFNLIVAVSQNYGIGLMGKLPWSLRSEMKYFAKTTRKVSDPEKKNAVIMGRKTYFGIPEKNRPLAGRLNVVLTRNPVPSNYPDNVILCTGLEEAMKRLEATRSDIENVWIVGGSEVYQEALRSVRCDRIYLTEIKHDFQCDTFFPKIPNDFTEIPLDDDIASGVQEENGIRYVYKILQKERTI